MKASASCLQKEMGNRILCQSRQRREFPLRGSLFTLCRDAVDDRLGRLASGGRGRRNGRKADNPVLVPQMFWPPIAAHRSDDRKTVLFRYLHTTANPGGKQMLFAYGTARHFSGNHLSLHGANDPRQHRFVVEPVGFACENRQDLLLRRPTCQALTSVFLPPANRDWAICADQRRLHGR